jgi:C-terminal processing protease CtpA/Prc
MSRRTNYLAASAALLTALWLSTGGLRAQEAPKDEKAKVSLTAAMRTEVIEGTLKRLNEAYVFPETAKKMEESIREHVAKKDYEKITSPGELARVLTAHLREVSHDKHLHVDYSAEKRSQDSRKEPSPEEEERMRRFASARNFAFEKVERLEGNIGYLDLRGFMPPSLAGDTAAAAMNFLANTDALILDLRKNGGGSPGMVALLCSYLFPADPVVHLNDLYFRPDNSTHQWWTLPYVPGKRYTGKDVYVLTSKRTFSAAEECTYNLKNLKRATIVGETTGGGAHPGGPQRINDHFFVWVPTGRAINPISKTNWEGTGVKPDVEVPAELALKTAHVAALQKVAEKKKGDPEASKQLQRSIGIVQKELDELKAKEKDSLHSSTR